MGKTMGVYYIRNTETNLMYIGSSVDIQKRIQTHVRALASGKHHSVYLQRAWNKYGAEAFEHGIAEPVDSRELLQVREQEWIDLFGEYNVTKFADRPTPPPMTDERRKHLSAMMKGRIGTMLGKKHTEETRAIMSRLRRGVKRPNSGAAISKGKTGSRLSEQTREKLRVLANERWNDPSKRAEFIQHLHELKEQGRGPWAPQKSRKPRTKLVKLDAHVKCYLRHTKKMESSPMYRKSYTIRSQSEIPLHNAHVVTWGKWRKSTSSALSMRRNWADPVFREKVKSGNLGVKRTDAQKAAISAANTGRRWTSERRDRYNATIKRPEVQAKLQSGRKGVPWSAEMREKILASRARTRAAKTVVDSCISA